MAAPATALRNMTGRRALIRQYMWPGDIPIAVKEGGQVYLVRTDHIGRPVFATTLSGTVVWRAKKPGDAVFGVRVGAFQGI